MEFKAGPVSDRVRSQLGHPGPDDSRAGTPPGGADPAAITSATSCLITPRRATSSDQASLPLDTGPNVGTEPVGGTRLADCKAQTTLFNTDGPAGAFTLEPSSPETHPSCHYQHILFYLYWANSPLSVIYRDRILDNSQFTQESTGRALLL